MQTSALSINKEIIKEEILNKEISSLKEQIKKYSTVAKLRELNLASQSRLEEHVHINC